MAHSHSGTGVPSFSPPRPEHAPPPGSPGTAPRPQGGGARPDPGQRRLLRTAAFTLAACGVLAFAIPAIAGAGMRAGAAAGAATSLLLIAALIPLTRQAGTGSAGTGQEPQAAERPRQPRTEPGERPRGQEDQYRRLMADLGDAADYLMRVQLPAILDGSPAPAPATAAVSNSEPAVLTDRVATAVAEEVAGLRERYGTQAESARTAVVTLARRVQASAHRIQNEATAMARRHGADADVLESSMKVDHAAMQQARNAQSLVVLCDEWPGQQWPDPLTLQDVVRAAAGRIVAYQRVEVLGDPGVAAAAAVAEPLIHLTAELLANAAQSSPPTTPVTATVRAVPRGGVIEIDDSGLGMEERQLQKARDIVSGRTPVTLGDMGEVPQTGLAVIGRYAQRHGFAVSLGTSPYGGVRAVVRVPPEMTEHLEPAAAVPPPPPRQLPAPEQRPATASEHGTRGTDTGGLPQRRSRRGEAPSGAPAAGAPAAAPDLPRRTPQEDGAFLGAYLSTGGSRPGMSPPPQAPGEETGWAGRAAPGDAGSPCEQD